MMSAPAAKRVGRLRAVANAGEEPRHRAASARNASTRATSHDHASHSFGPAVFSIAIARYLDLGVDLLGRQQVQATDQDRRLDHRRCARLKPRNGRWFAARTTSQCRRGRCPSSSIRARVSSRMGERVGEAHAVDALAGSSRPVAPAGEAAGDHAHVIGEIHRGGARREHVLEGGGGPEWRENDATVLRLADPIGAICTRPPLERVVTTVSQIILRIPRRASVVPGVAWRERSSAGAGAAAPRRSSLS